MTMQVVETVSELRQARAKLRGSVGLVTTMGALHAGHMALVETARAENDSLMATIFVNPTQFGPNEDLAAYPRDLPHDLGLLEVAGVDLVFTPSPDVIYPAGYQTYVTVEQVTQGLEGAHRPGHFRGVATVVAKLFNLAQANRAYFGQKDAQQVAVIRRMAQDLNFPVDVIVCPTVREADGLALSSRNVYLTPEQRKAATALSQSLLAAAHAYEQGGRDPQVLTRTMREVLDAEPLAETEYVSAALAATLEEVTTATDELLLMSLAVRVGRTRLIDNLLLPASLNTREGLAALGAI
jgi:pantoate--beta-alanine ligase